MNAKELARIAKSAGMRKCAPGDKILSPHGKVMHEEPRVFVTGCMAYAFMLNGRSIAVIIFRPRTPTLLRYCDLEGIIREEKIPPLDFEGQMLAGMHRVAQLARKFMGERHPDVQGLASAVPAGNA